VEISITREVIEEVTGKIASLSPLRSLVIPPSCLTRCRGSVGAIACRLRNSFSSVVSKAAHEAAGKLKAHVHLMSSANIEHIDGLPQPQRNWAILTIALGLVMAVMDGAIANVALPTIAKDLNADPAFSIWIVNGYQLAITISLLPLASLGEIVSYRRVYLAGLLLFTVNRRPILTLPPFAKSAA
jgi:hypothetical protein